jgi:hypothetical protein
MEKMADPNYSKDSRLEEARRRSERPSENDALDRELDTALAKYVAVEPRAGLEERVLANFRAQGEHAPAQVWGRWQALGVAAAVLVVAALSLIGRPAMWRPGKPAPDIKSHQPAAAAPGDKQPGTRVATNDLGSLVRRAGPAAATRPARHGVRPPQVLDANGPRLDHFPSPRPLSDEEKLLVLYVRDFPRDAVMIAQAQAESEKEMEQLSGRGSLSANQNQQ